MTAARRSRDRLSPAEYSLLGMIVLAPGNDRQIHGYDLNRRMTEGAISIILRLEPGMLYHYLKKLAKRGLITSTVEEQEGRPARHLHAVTASGREAFEAWLAEPVQATREIRLEFLLKLWYARHISDNRARTLIHSQREVVQSLIVSLEEQLRDAPNATEDDRFAQKVIGLRLAQNHAAASWLADLEEAP